MRLCGLRERELVRDPYGQLTVSEQAVDVAGRWTFLRWPAKAIRLARRGHTSPVAGRSHLAAGSGVGLGESELRRGLDHETARWTRRMVGVFIKDGSSQQGAASIGSCPPGRLAAPRTHHLTRALGRDPPDPVAGPDGRDGQQRRARQGARAEADVHVAGDAVARREHPQPVHGHRPAGRGRIVAGLRDLQPGVALRPRPATGSASSRTRCSAAPPSWVVSSATFSALDWHTARPAIPGTVAGAVGEDAEPLPAPGVWRRPRYCSPPATPTGTRARYRTR
jgi:hypothetical protein